MIGLEGYWEELGYNRYLLIGVIVLFVCHLIFLIHRGLVVASRKRNESMKEEEGVSVIITSDNKAEFLKKNLEAFLTQDYPNYEVVVVDECSEDDTQQVLSDMQQKYPNLRTTRIFPETKFRSTKKIAINIGVLAAKYDILLFSEINCVPESPAWIRTMQAYFDRNTAVVLGFANYVAEGGNGIRRYFRSIRFMQTMTMIRRGMNIVGEGYNMGYRKSYYIDKKGFSRNSQLYIGYDNEMVKILSRKGEVRVVNEPDAYVQIRDNRKKTWLEDCSYYYAKMHEWSLWEKFCTGFDFWIEFLLYGLSFYLIFTGVLHKYVALIPLLTFLIDIITINVCLKHLYQKKLFLTSFMVNIVGFTYKWYYSIYSIFTSKKWR